MESWESSDHDIQQGLESANSKMFKYAILRPCWRQLTEMAVDNLGCNTAYG